MQTSNQKTKLRDRFCHLFVKLRNAGEAALKCGFNEQDALYEGMKLLSEKNTKRQINSIYEKNLLNGSVRSGLERIAFGSINDAVKLMVLNDDISPDDILKLDLFNVSEIKKVKGGGLEIKIADRFKALEKLWEIQNTTNVNSSAESFLNALGNCSENSDNIKGDDINEV